MSHKMNDYLQYITIMNVRLLYDKSWVDGVDTLESIVKSVSFKLISDQTINDVDLVHNVYYMSLNRVLGWRTVESVSHPYNRL